MTALTIQHNKQGLVEIIHLNGILNADTSSQLEELLEKLVDTECPRILLNVEQLTYISSAGIGCFIGVIKRIRAKSGDLCFSRADAKVKRVFRLLDMEDFFKFFNTFEEGVAYFGT